MARSWGLDLHILTLSYPWLGLPVEILRARQKPIGPLISAHLVRVIVLYSMYEACQLAWAMWLYNKPVQSGLQLWVYGVVMVWEYFSMIYLRCATALRFLPKLTLLFFCAFHFYFYTYSYAFFDVALLAMFTAMLHSMLYFVHTFELPASTRGEISFEQPRALYTELPWPAWDAALPPSWSLFLPLNVRHQGIYQNDAEDDDVVGGADTGDDVGGPLFEDEAEEAENPLTDRPAGQEAADDAAQTMPIDRGITDADDGPGSELENEIELGRRRRPRGNER